MARISRPSGRLLAIILGTMLVAYGAATSAMVNITHQKLPAVALSIDSDDPVALVRNAQIQLGAGALPAGGNDELLGTVRKSVEQLPLNAPAFRLYGLASAANADIPGVRAQMAVSERIERRDAAAQLWLIEDAVQRNDVSAALRHYDIALRIEQSTRAVLYPVLTDALESPIIRERFVEYIKNPPPWMESFLRFAVSNTKQPTAIADLARISGGFPDGTAYSSLDRELLTQLFANEEFEAAMAHFGRIKGVGKSVPTTLALTNESTAQAHAPVTWQPFSIEGIEPFVVAASLGGDAVEIEAEMLAGYTGPMARKFLALKPGSYGLTATLRAEDFTSNDQGSWRITCAGNANAEALFAQTFEFGEEIGVSGTFVVPANCPVQLVTVSADTTVRSGYVKLILAEALLSRGN